MNNPPNNDFMNILIQFDMMSETGQSTGLVFVGEDTSDPSEIMALEYAEKYEATAVYFRRFDDGRPPIPQIYIYNITENEKDDGEIGELYKRLWNSGQVPLFFIFYKTEVKIFSCLKHPEFDPSTGDISYSIFEKIKLVSNINKEMDKLKDFSAKRFDNGTFWTNPKYKDKFKLKETAYLKLLNKLKQLRKDIIKSRILEDNIAQKLLVMSILVKYLEEREDENGDNVFPPRFFRDYSDGPDSFLGVLRKKGACLDLFDYLGSADRFNGEIFKWTDEEERKILKNADLNGFADFFEGKLDGRQYTFWRLYSFNDLPIELISNIYEEFLKSKKGIVYTPPYLVNFLIDEQMPFSDFHKTDFKVIDPACGSGVFLVAAFRRMIHWWRIRNNWKKPGANNLKELKKILENSIFGVDKYKEAVRLTFFSLSLALLDELSPKVIWENLKFDNLLESNLISEDFFKLINDNFFQSDFDLVIGNPPFESKLTTPDAKQIEKQKIEERPKLPDNQIALLFLEQAMNLCKEGSDLCMVTPSGPFLYNSNSKEFRTYFLSTYHVPQIIDFTFLSAMLFESVNVAVAVVFAKKQEPIKDNLLHVTVRRTKPAKEKLYFELDYYEFHKISHREALENRLVWKANLLGGGRLKHLMARFAPLRTLGDYLKEAVNSNGWKIAEGFIVGNKNEIAELVDLRSKIEQLSSKEKERLDDLKKKYKKADYLTGKNTLPTDALTEKGIDESQVDSLKEKYFYRSSVKNKAIFKSPHLLIKEGVAKNSIPIAFRNDDDDLSFKHSIIGIHTPEKQIDELLEIEKRIKNNRTYLFYVAGFSGRYMIGRATSILKEDIESLPYPEDEKELALSEIEQILVDDVLDYMLDFRKKGETSVAEKSVDDYQLHQFSEIYCRVLNSVYKEFKPHEPLKTGSFICFPFYYKDKPQIKTGNPDELEADLYELIQNNTSTNSRIVRMLRVYENNTIYLIKPKQTRYWLRSVAIRDADDTFADLVVQGY